MNAVPDCPRNFGYKTKWLAIYAEAAEDVLPSLKLSNLTSTNWASGLAAVDQGRTFVTPSIDEWVLIVSSSIPDLGEPSTQMVWESMMRRLSATHEEVQYFCTQRVVEYHTWARYIEGEENRAYAYLGERGETLINRGDLTPAEMELGYRYFDETSPEAMHDGYWEREDLCFPDEDHVLQIAGEWSLNPSLLEEMNLPSSLGWVGDWNQLPEHAGA